MTFFAKNKKRNSDAGRLSFKQAKLFYFQELFGDYRYIKKQLFLIVGFCLFGEIFKLLFKNNPIRQSSLSEKIIFCMLPIFGAILFVLSFLKSLSSKSNKILQIKYVLLFVANMCIFGCIFLRIYLFFRDSFDNNATTTKADVLEGAYVLGSGVYISLLLEVLNPVWPLKIIVPLSYNIALLVSAYQAEDYSKSVIWVRFLVALVNIILISWFKAQFRWKLFQKRVEGESWNKIHALILNKVRSSIAVLDVQGKIVYNNKEFTKLIQSSYEFLLKNLIGLKKRKNGGDKDNDDESELNQELIGRSEWLRLMSEPRIPMNISSDPCIPAPSTGCESAETLEELLGKSRELLMQGLVNEEDYSVYDGRMLVEGNDKPCLYEVSISFMVEIQRIILIIRDTTQQAKIISLENNNEYKDKLMASVSHELRTPLNGNLSLVEAAIEHNEIPATLKEQFLIPAYRSGKLLLHLINDILDFSQIAAGKLRLNFESELITDTIKNCFQLMELQAKSKLVDLKLEIDERLSYFTTDHDRVSQIILNLLSNALKFTFKGSVTLKAKILTPFHLKISVKDTGIGIKQEDLNKLFKEFTRLDNPRLKPMNGRGVGLGLTIADKLARRLGPGSTSPQTGIKVKSEPQKGSSFSFIIMDKNKERTTMDILPRQDTNCRNNNVSVDNSSSKVMIKFHQVASIDNLNGDFPNIDEYINVEHSIKRYPSQLLSRTKLSKFSTKQDIYSDCELREHLAVVKTPRKKRLLIIDDEPFNILAIESLLKHSDFLIDTAFNGKEAIEKIVKLYIDSRWSECFDLIIMDCQMPVMDGYETAKVLTKMMKNNELPEIPIIGCTALDTNRAIEACYQAGMKEVIRKPLSKLKLDQNIKHFLG